MSTRKLLIDCVLEPCGHRFQCWTETEPNGQWSVHFHAPCREAEAVAREVAATVAPRVPVREAE